MHEHEVRGIVVDVAALVIVHCGEEHLECRAIEQVLAGVNFVTHVAPGIVIGVEDRRPALAQLRKGRLDQPGRPRRPWINEGPGESARKRHHGLQAEIPRSLGAEHHLFHRPGLSLLRFAAHRGRREGVEDFIVGRVNGDELALEMGGKLGDGDAVPVGRPLHFVAVALGLGGLLQVEKPAIPARHLHTLVAERGRPLADRVERIERRRIAGELREINRRSLDVGRHLAMLLRLPGRKTRGVGGICSRTKGGSTGAAGATSSITTAARRDRRRSTGR